MKKLLDFGFAMYRKYREQFWYLVIGVLTTLVDLAVYYALEHLTPLHYLLRYWIAWAAAVLFAFYPNRTLVFRNEKKDGVLVQFGQFVSSRIATLVIGEVLMWLLVSVCHFSDAWMKPVVQVLIVVLNYLFSKLFVFRT